MSPDLLPAFWNLAVTGLTVTPTLVCVALATSAHAARCPACGTESDRIHARYRRLLADLPIAGRRFVLCVTARKFLCGNPSCGRHIFCERLGGLAAAHARTTDRLATLHRAIGLALGGEPGSRLAGELAVPASGDTLLRRVKSAHDGPEPAYRFVGIDDFALRRGHTYGTILVDLERGRVIDIFEGRDGKAVEAWLRAHPGVEVVTRDRWAAYATAASAGAPQAAQVADRWHLLKNLREVVERLFERSAGAVREALAPPEPATPELPPAVPVPPASPPGAPAEAPPERTEGRVRREENHRRVRELHAQGQSLRAIARQLRLSRNSARRYLRTEQYTDGRGNRKRKTRLDKFTPYVDARIRQGCRNAAELHRELASQGSTSSACAVRRFMNRRLAAAGIRRERANAASPAAPPPPSARQLSYEFIRRPSDRSAEGQARLDRVRACVPGAGSGLELGEEFARMVRRSSAVPLAEWLGRAESSGVPELRGFAEGLRQDEAAVSAAIREEWSNGQVEGQVNRLKLIKRAGFGRAGFRLLRARVRAGP
jgi:transposase